MKKYIMLFFSVLSALFILTACGALATEEPVTGSSPSGEQVAAASWESMGNQMQMASFLIGDIHYYQVYDWDEESEEKELERISIFRDDHSGSGAECVTSVDHGDILWYQADEGGDLYLFYQVGEGERQFFLQRWTASGTLVYEQEIWQEDSGNREGALSAVAHGAVSTAGEICLAASTGELFFFSRDGHLVDMAYADWNRETYQGNRCGLVNAGEQGIYVYQIEGTDEIFLWKVDFDRCALDKAVSFSIGVQGKTEIGNIIVQPSQYTSLEIFDGYEMGILVSDSTGLWQYRPDDKGTTLLFSWGDSRVNLKDYMIDAVGVLPEGGFYLLARRSYEDVAYVKVDYRDVQELPQKQTVTMGVLTLFPFQIEEVEEVVSRFNRQTEVCQVELVTYDSIDAFHLDLVKGQGPDLVYLYSMDDAALEEKGVLENLSPYFAASNVVKEEDLLDNVREAGTIRGRLVEVIPEFGLSGWLVEKGTTNDGGWTVDQFLTLAESNPDSLVIDQNESIYKSFILDIALVADLDSYLDGEGGCSFDSAEFISLLERIQKLPIPARVRNDPLEPGYFDADWKYFSEKGYLLKECPLGSLDVQTYSYYNGSLANGSYAEMAGYPNQGGRPVYKLIIEYRFGINAASDKKESAWTFLEYLLSAGYQGSMFSFPVRKDSFEDYMKKDTLYRSKLETSQEDRELLRRMVENARAGGETGIQNDIKRIIREETAPLWAGDYSAEEVAGKIQNRVLLYLAE